MNDINHETDQLTKTDINVSCENLSNVGVSNDVQVALVALNKMRDVIFRAEATLKCGLLDGEEYEIVERALAQQQPVNAELLEVLKELRTVMQSGGFWGNLGEIEIDVESIIERAEQKGGE